MSHCIFVNSAISHFYDRIFNGIFFMVETQAEYNVKYVLYQCHRIYCVFFE